MSGSPQKLCQELCLVDGHVHLHPGADIGGVLTGAAAHMAALAQARGWTARPPGMLLLTEIAGVDAFGALPEAAGDWRIEPTGEEISRLARPQDGTAPIAIVSGRQVVSDDGLEVLALGTRAAPVDGGTLDNVLDRVSETGALAVLPWGVGKWSGARGRQIAALIDRTGQVPGPPGIWLADSGVRPAFLSRPALLARAEAHGIGVLAGSDPLPLAAEAGKAGRFGFVANHGFDPDRPFAALHAWLDGLDGSPETYGRLEGVWGFVRAQAAMQIRKRLRH